jgi:hypothetical protein
MAQAAVEPGTSAPAAAGLPGEREARNLLFALTGVASLIYLYNALFLPGTLTFAPFTIQDDARQFLAWMARLDDPGALQGDLLASYWHDVCPFLYRAIYWTANLLGLPPTLFARLLPIALLFLCAWLAWRVALRLTRRPIAAFVAAAFVVSFLIHEDSLYSATPRAFSTPLFLLFLDGLLRERGLVMIPALFLLGLIYPTTALVGVTMLGLSRIGMRPWRIDLSKRSWLLAGIGGAAVLVAILPFAAADGQWGPTLTVSEALQQPNLSTPQGRSSIVGIGGNVDYMCSARMGLLPEIVPCWATSVAVLPNFLLLVPLLLLAWRAVRSGRYGPGEEPGNLIHSWALVAAIAWWAVATLVAFKLHLPSRYTQRTLSVLEFLVIGQMLGMLLDRKLQERRHGSGRVALGGGIALFLLACFLTPTPGLSAPADPEAVARIAAMPSGTVIGGVSDQLDYLPALTGRPTLATIEHSIPYHKGYFGQLRERLEAGLMAVATPDPAVLEDYVRRYRVGVIAVDQALFEYRELPARWSTVVPDAVRTAQETLAAGPSVLQQRAAACTTHRGQLVLLDAACLVRPRVASADGRPI